MMTPNDIALQIQESIQDSLLTATGTYGAPVASGKLLSSIEVKPNDEYGYDVYAEDYAYFIENGRKPSKLMSKASKSLGKPLAPPLQPILDWVRKRRIGNGKDEATAYRIMNALRYKQTLPRPFISNGIEQASNTMLDETANLIFQPLDKAFE